MFWNIWEWVEEDRQFPHSIGWLIIVESDNMDSIAIGLSSSDLQTKLGAIDTLLGRLEKGKRGCILDATNNETKKKIYSSSVNLLKDVNTKVVHPAFDIISAIIDDPAFQNLKAII